MTKEIQKAIDFIHTYMHPVDDSESEKRKLKYRNMAIRSLEAWEKVKEEITFERDRKLGGEAFEAIQYKCYQNTLDIINKHLSEVEVSNAIDQAPTH